MSIRKIFALALALSFTYTVQARAEQTVEINAGLWMHRQVKYEMPQGQPPKNGWPAVILYQGTMKPVEFVRADDAPYGLVHEAELIQRLLKHGFAVIAPNAIFKVGWVTNVATIGYEFTSDYYFISNTLGDLKRFGPIDENNLFATGISSGGYNTSRMAITWPGKFRALAIHSGSYATCLGEKCFVPEAMPKDHPPTLFLYGAHDDLVPRWTVDAYVKQLQSNGTPVELYVNEQKGHEYFAESPEKIVSWFEAYIRQ